MNKKITITLSEKERFILWFIACWFRPPLVTGVLKSKLYPGDEVSKMMYGRYDNQIYDRMIEVGTWLKGRQEIIRKEQLWTTQRA